MRCATLPPIPRSNIVEHQRRADIVRAVFQLDERLTNRKSSLAESHALFPIEEDRNILQQAGIIPRLAFMSTSNQIEIDKWLYDDTNKSYAYEYHEMFLRMLNSVDPPKSHWLLKWPLHSVYLDTVFARYPNAAVVMCHRRLDEVLPSFFRLIRTTTGSSFNETDARTSTALKTRTIRHLDQLTGHILEFRQRSRHLQNTSHIPIFDIAYTDLMKQTITTVHRIYDHFGLRWSKEFEMAMNTCDKANSQREDPPGAYRGNDCGHGNHGRSQG
ncbi:unnamed protein product [Rotaria sp. Silwood1]|nr:unnamed protein product [Rotaria sp. Silwood1]